MDNKVKQSQPQPQPQLQSKPSRRRPRRRRRGLFNANRIGRIERALADLEALVPQATRVMELSERLRKLEAERG